MGLSEIRKSIDLLDSEILKLLNHRMELVLMAKRFKDTIQDSQREKEVLSMIRMNSTDLISPEFIETLYREIIKESRKVQENAYALIAFQGEHGAYGEVASKAWDGTLIPIPCKEFREVFEGVESGLYDYGIVPVENTLGGAVSQVNQLLINTDLCVVGAVELPIHLCLLALPGSDHRDIRSVYSHPQALSQCRRFLARNKLEPLEWTDTAGAAKMLAEKKPKRAAAIASKLSARLCNLEIIKENVQDLESNLTRFLVLAKEENKGQGHKCSIRFCTEHKAGALFSALEVFAKRHMNLTRIESIPNEPGNYAFFLDFEGSNKEDRVAEALEEVKSMTTDFKLMGCYRERKIR